MEMSPPSSLPEEFARLRSAYRRAPFPLVAERRAWLESLSRLVKAHTNEWEAAIASDFGTRSPHETRLLEIFPSLSAIAHAKRHVAVWMRPRKRSTSLWFLPGRSAVLAQPLGVVGIVVPWNYPLFLAIGPLVSALAAGNRAMVKMSESAPATGELLASLARQYFPSGEISVVNGGPDVAAAFCALPFDHLLFTGSTAVGRRVMQAAAANLTPVTLELGGKSPAIIGTGFPLAEAAGRVMYGKCLNAGQTCVAPDYVLVPEPAVEAFIAAAREAVGNFYPSLASNADFTAIVDRRHRDRLARCVDDAVARGARAFELNPAGEDLAPTGKFAPTLLTGVDDTMVVMQEEIFGPILPIVPYRTLDDAIAYVNARPRPLALYVFDLDRQATDRVLRETVSGGATVNETILHIAQDDLPFGGVGPSGMGCYHGRDGFETFSQRKAVFRQSRFNGLKLFRAPYGRRFDFLIRFLLR